MVEQFPIWDLKFHRARLAVLPDHAHARPTPKPFIHRVGSALARFFERNDFGFRRQRFQKALGGLKYAQPLSFLHPFRQIIRFGHIFQQVVKIRGGDPLDCHPAQAPQLRQQFFGQKSACQENCVVMHPTGFMEFNLDAIGRIYGVSLARRLSHPSLRLQSSSRHLHGKM